MKSEEWKEVGASHGLNYISYRRDNRTDNQKQSEKIIKKVLTYKIKRDIVIPYLTDRKYIKNASEVWKWTNLKE